MPHDTIDLIGGTEFPSAGTKTPSSSYLVCMVASSRVYTVFTEPNSTTIKTPTTFYLMLSGKLLGIDQPFYPIAHRKPVQLTVLNKIKCTKEGSLMACKSTMYFSCEAKFSETQRIPYFFEYRKLGKFHC